MPKPIFVVASTTLTSTGTAVSTGVPFDVSTMQYPTHVVVKATGQGAYVRLSANGSAATNADPLVQAGDHAMFQVAGRTTVSVLSDGASSTVSIGALSTGVWGSKITFPAALFAAGEQGVWYDPSDYSTLFQDSAGTTPCTAGEQAVGLMLDKRVSAGTGYWSGYFDGTGDYLTVPSNAAFQFGTGDFTIECWVNKPAAANGQ